MQHDCTRGLPQRHGGLSETRRGSLRQNSEKSVIISPKHIYVYSHALTNVGTSFENLTWLVYKYTGQPVTTGQPVLSPLPINHQHVADLGSRSHVHGVIHHSWSCVLIILLTPLA